MGTLIRMVRDYTEQPDSATAEPQSSLTSITYWVVFCFVLIALLVPLWIVRYPGMVDYPNHLARCYVVYHYFDSPVWSTRLVLVRTPRPNLAIEMCVVPLLRIFPLAVSGKLFLTISVLLFFVGCVGIGKQVTGGPSWMSLAAAFAFFNTALYWGFVNYMFGVAVFLCSFAYWLQVHRRIRFLQLCLCALLGLLCFLSHLSSFIFFAGACCVISLFEFLQERKIAPVLWKMGWVIVPCMMFVAFMGHGGQLGDLRWLTGTRKLTQILGPLRTYNIAFDVVVAIAALIFLAILSRRAGKHPIMLVGLVFLLCYFVTPYEIFTGEAADSRFLLPAFVIAVLALVPRWGKSQKIAFGLLMVVLFIRQALILAYWTRISSATEHVIAMGDNLPTGARIFILPPTGDSKLGSKTINGYENATEWWTVTHQADINRFFALQGQQPVESRHRHCNDLESASCRSQYDYIWTIDPPNRTLSFLRTIATVKSTWSSVTLWKVRVADEQ